MLDNIPLLLCAAIIIAQLAIIAVLLCKRSRSKQKNKLALQQKNAALQDAYQQIKELTRIDPLTKIPNCKAILELLDYEKERCERFFHPFAMALIEVVQFNALTETYGLDCSAFTVLEISHLIRKAIRQQDRLGQWSGNQFMLFLPETDHTGSQTIAGKLQQLIHESTLIYIDPNDGHSLALSVECAVGVAVYAANDQQIGQCIEQAGQALALAKTAGQARGCNCSPMSTNERA